MRIVLIAAVVAAAVTVSSVAAWGAIGHETMGAMTDRIMETKARERVLEFFKEDTAGETFATASIWADKVDHNGLYMWSAPLHYVDTPDFACKFDYDRDCAEDKCVVGAILNYTARVQNEELTDDDRIEALKWLIHYVEDIHQPLHVSFTSDHGGNSVKGHFMGKSVNMHGLWDQALIMHRIKTNFSKQVVGYDTKYEEYLEKVYNDADKSSWHPCVADKDLKTCLGFWAQESAEVTCNYAYKAADGSFIKNGFNLDQEYFNRVMPVLETQIVKGSYRLSLLLNSIFPHVRLTHVRRPANPNARVR